MSERVDPAAMLDALRKHGIDQLFGVPDSLLREFCDFATAVLPSTAHTITANEGSAVAMAIGHFLGSGSPAAVYMQNSGLGNAINPLLSLADPSVYAIPMFLIIGWRGAPGTRDEPQHVAQGAVTRDLLQLLGVPHEVIGAGRGSVGPTVARLARQMLVAQRPVAVLIEPGTFAASGIDVPTSGVRSSLRREQAIESIVQTIPAGAIVVGTTGHVSRELYEIRHRLGMPTATDFLTVGGMGHASSIAASLAKARPNRLVVCLDGDGAMLMHLGALPVIAGMKPANLIHVVLNNGVHDSVGGQPTVGESTDFGSIADACGYTSSVRVDSRVDIQAAVTRAVESPGPVLIEVRVCPGARGDLGRPAASPRENRDCLMTELALQ